MNFHLNDFLLQNNTPMTILLLYTPVPFSPSSNEGSFLQLPGKSPDNDALHADVAPELIPAAQNVSSQVGYIGKGWLGEGGSLVELVGDVVVVFLVD